MLFSKKLSENLKKKGILKEVLDYDFNKHFFKSVVKYVIHKNDGIKIELPAWIKTNLQLPSSLQKELRDLKLLPPSDALMRQIVRFVNKNITYTKDSEGRYGMVEYWQTPQQTWMNLEGDCEDGAILIYAIAKWLGFDDRDMYLVAGDVVGGGHCYLVYRSQEDGNEYPMDWCYWFDESIRMKIPYAWRLQYYFGYKEWFRFNSIYGYKPK